VDNTATEFLIALNITVPEDTPADVVEGMKERE
jgi:muconolactone delta-isomerase